MSHFGAFVRFWWDFVVGDDVRVAIGLGAALGVSALLAHEWSITAWWFLPLAVVAVLAESVLRAARPD
jgi:hypothetical protein